MNSTGLRHRKLQKFYAKLNGYFWIACPLCGREFGGHEWHDIGDSSSRIYNDPECPSMGTAICPVCTAQGKGEKLIIDLRKPGESFCFDCPDHEGCMQAYPCSLVKRVNMKRSSDENTPPVSG